jgi:uncharacterized Tic20 family protein
MDEITVSTPGKDDRNFAMLAHLLGIFTGFLGSLIIWLVKKDESPFVAQEAKEALNFQITMVIGGLIAYVLSFILIGLLLFPVLYILNIIFCILGAVAASKGQGYRYPFAIRLVN